MARPSFELTPEILEKVESMASRGLTHAQICLCIGCSETTLYKMKRKFTQFTEAIKKGQAKGLMNVSNKLYQKALAGDNTCMIFYLKSRGGEPWQEGVVQNEDSEQITEVVYTVVKGYK